MKIMPAIDLLDGKCVRLLKGDYSKVSNYNDNPIEQVEEDKLVEEKVPGQTKLF